MVVETSGSMLPAAAMSFNVIWYFHIISTIQAMRRSVSSGLTDDPSFAAAKYQNLPATFSLST